VGSTKGSETKAVGIVRVSEVGERDDSLKSPETQVDRIKEACEREGLELIAEPVRELDVSGGRPLADRAALRDAVEAVERGRAQVVIAAYFDRLFRSLKVQQEFVERVEAAGGRVLALDTGAISQRTAAQWLSSTFLGAVSEYYRRSARERAREGQIKAIEQGIAIVRGLHFGYLKDERKHLVIDPATAPIVRELFVRRAQRMSWTGLADWLNGVCPREDGRRWIHQHVRRIIESPIYKGWSVSGEVVNSEAHEPIVTLAEWDAANAVKGGRAASNGRPLPLLAGMLRCASCRYVMRRVGGGERGTTEAYVCAKKHGGGICEAPAYVRAEDIEGLVMVYFGIAHFQSTRQPYDPDRAAVEHAERELTDLEARFEALSADDARLDAMGADRFYSDLKRRRVEIERAQAELDQARAKVEREKHRPIMLADDWDKLDASAKHAILRRAIDSIYVKRGNNPRRQSSSDLHQRVWIRYAGEDDLVRPERGRIRVGVDDRGDPIYGTAYTIGDPVHFPEDRNLPQWYRPEGGLFTIEPELKRALGRIAESAIIRPKESV